jgi:hypothetical protein
MCTDVSEEPAVNTSGLMKNTSHAKNWRGYRGRCNQGCAVGGPVDRGKCKESTLVHIYYDYIA